MNFSWNRLLLWTKVILLFSCEQGPLMEEGLTNTNDWLTCPDSLNPIWKWKRCLLSHVQLYVTPWTIDRQAPLSMGFSRQEYWSGYPFPSPGDLPNPGIEPGSPSLQADSLQSKPPGKTYQSEKDPYPPVSSSCVYMTLTRRESAFCDFVSADKE